MTHQAPLLVTNTRLIDPASGLDAPGHILCKDGLIAGVSTGTAQPSVPEGTEVFDAQGRITAPGLVDMRAHAVDIPAALAGGVTTLTLQPDQTTCIDTDAVVERIRRRSVEDGRLSVIPMGALTKGMAGTEITEIGQMYLAGSRAFTDCRQSVADARVMRRIMEYVHHFGALVVDFACEPSLAHEGVAREGEIATRLGLNGIPAIAEAIQIERNVRLAEFPGCRVHIALVSTREGVEVVRAAKARGVKISAATAPHYLYLNDNAVEGYRTFAKFSPPLGGEEDRLALIAGVADGTIDTLVSDHDPKAADVKRLPFAQAAHGVVGLETLLPLTLTAVHAGKLDLMVALKALTSAPAAHLGLNAGQLKEGFAADISVFDTDTPYKLERHQLKAQSQNMIADSLLLQGKVWATFKDGVCHYNAARDMAATSQAGRAD